MVDRIVTGPQCSCWSSRWKHWRCNSLDLEKSPRFCDGKACHIKRHFGETTTRVTIVTHASTSSCNCHYPWSLLWLKTEKLRNLDTCHGNFKYQTWIYEDVLANPSVFNQYSMYMMRFGLPLTIKQAWFRMGTKSLWGCHIPKKITQTSIGITMQIWGIW